MRKDMLKALKQKLTSDEMQIIQRFICQTNEEMQLVMDLYSWDEKKRIYTKLDSYNKLK